MTRRDPISSETERPHFYSQFWVDVAGGKRDLTAAHADADELEAEPELDEDEDFAAAIPEVSDVRPAAKKPAKERKPEPARPTITSLAELANIANIERLMKNSAEMESEEVPDLETGAMGDLEPFDSGEPSVVTDFDMNQVEEPEAEPAESFAGEDEEFGDFDEDEEEDEWGGARKPSKQNKQPKRRDRRTNF